MGGSLNLLPKHAHSTQHHERGDDQNARGKEKATDCALQDQKSRRHEGPRSRHATRQTFHQPRLTPTNQVGADMVRNREALINRRVLCQVDGLLSN